MKLLIVEEGSTRAGVGAGLGLSIVRHVARLHGGEVQFVPGIGHAEVEERLLLSR